MPDRGHARHIVLSTALISDIAVCRACVCGSVDAGSTSSGFGSLRLELRGPPDTEAVLVTDDTT